MHIIECLIFGVESDEELNAGAWGPSGTRTTVLGPNFQREMSVIQVIQQSSRYVQDLVAIAK